MSDFLTKQRLRKVTNNLGRLQIDEDKVICYVDNKKLYNNLDYIKNKEIFYRKLKLNGEEFTKETSKPIYYVIEDFRFDYGLKITTDSNCKIIFKNCSFFDQIYIEYAKDITFESNKYYNDNCLFMHGPCFLTGWVENLKFINDNFFNSRRTLETNFFGLNLNVKNLEIKNSSINLTTFDKDINITAKSINLFNSIISGGYIQIKTDKLYLDNKSEIQSRTQIILEDESSKNNNNIILELKAPKIIYNGFDLSGNNEISPKGVKQEFRQTLINQLKELRDKAIKINEDKLNEYKNKINNEGIGRIIKK